MKAFFPFFILLAALALFSMATFSMTGLPALKEMEKRISKVQKENQILKRKILNRREEIRFVESDELGLETKAREELGMVKDGEKVYLFPES